MGSLQEELKKLPSLDNMTFDDDLHATHEVLHETPPAGSYPKTKRQIWWEWLKANPAKSAVELAAAHGGKPVDASTVLAAFCSRGIATRARVDGIYLYRTLGDTYPEYTLEMRRQHLQQGRKTMAVVAKQTQPRRSYTRRAKPAAPPQAELSAPKSTDATTILNGLSVLQARELYDRLKQLFGG